MSRSSSSMLPTGTGIKSTTTKATATTTKTKTAAATTSAAALNEATAAKVAIKSTPLHHARTEADGVATPTTTAAVAAGTTIKPIPKLRHMTSKNNSGHRHGSKSKQQSNVIKHLPKSDN